MSSPKLPTAHGRRPAALATRRSDRHSRRPKASGPWGARLLPLRPPAAPAPAPATSQTDKGPRALAANERQALILHTQSTRLSTLAGRLTYRPSKLHETMSVPSRLNCTAVTGSAHGTRQTCSTATAVRTRRAPKPPERQGKVARWQPSAIRRGLRGRFWH